MCLSCTCDSRTFYCLQLAYSLPAVPLSHSPHLTHKPVLSFLYKTWVQWSNAHKSESAEKQNSMYAYFNRAEYSKRCFSLSFLSFCTYFHASSLKFKTRWRRNSVLLKTNKQLLQIYRFWNLNFTCTAGFYSPTPDLRPVAPVKGNGRKVPDTKHVLVRNVLPLWNVTLVLSYSISLWSAEEYVRQREDVPVFITVGSWLSW